MLKVCLNVPLRIGMKVDKKPGTETACIWACKVRKLKLVLAVVSCKML